MSLVAELFKRVGNIVAPADKPGTIQYVHSNGAIESVQTRETYCPNCRTDRQFALTRLGALCMRCGWKED